ncbi:MAG TPA: DegT/DnrJ/EryC1/StrS family aminotransferase [Ktedonobacteraceae bacterium]|nr:DegT/DnrJ/EryC1/StrS family aminotransferase [Ktedonobacteraceae bacterium]
MVNNNHSMKIKPVGIYFHPEDRIKILNQIDNCLSKGQLSHGEHVEAFEAEFAAYTGSRYAVAMSCGTATIENAMRLQSVAGKDVLVQANTFFSTALGPINAGANVRLVDVDPKTFAPGVAELESALTEQTVGVLIVHMGGIITPELPAIKEWCTRRGLWLFEDCAHAHGSRLNGIHSGKFGFGGGFSFFATKVITSGEGGMFITDDEEIAKEARLYRHLGKPEPWTSYHVRLGGNARMSELQAIVGRVQLKRIDEFIGWREKIAHEYTSSLRHVEGIVSVLPTHRSSWYKYPILLDKRIKRKDVKEHLARAGIQLSGEIYEWPLHLQPALANRFEGQHFSQAEYVCSSHICLPIYYGMKQEEVKYVVEALTDAIQKFLN